MSLHLVKLCVGVGEISELADWQKRRRREKKRVYHVTRMMPRRAAELLDGGSLYWVIRGLILVRQRIIAIEPFVGDDEVDRLLAAQFETARTAVGNQRFMSHLAYRQREPIADGFVVVDD